MNMTIQLSYYSLVPMIFSFICSIIGSSFIYLYIKKINTILFNLGLCINCLCLFIFIAGVTHSINHYITAIWLGRFYYLFLLLGSIFYYIFVNQIVKSSNKTEYWIILPVVLILIIFIFTEYFFPLVPCEKNFCNRFIYKKGFIYYAFMIILYLFFISALIKLWKNQLSSKVEHIINKNYFFIGTVFLMLLGLNDVASLSDLYKTIPLFSYGLIIFIFAMIFPILKKYIFYYSTINKSYNETIHALAKLLESRDTVNYSDYKRIGLIAKNMGKFMKFDKKRLQNLELASILHNIGYIGIPDKYIKSQKFSAKIREKLDKGKRIASNLLVFHKLKELINFPVFKDISDYDHSLDCQILAIADYINQKTKQQYLKHKINLDATLDPIIKSKYINPQLKKELIHNRIRLEKTILYNLIVLEDNV